MKDEKESEDVGSNDHIASDAAHDIDVNESALIRKIDWRLVPTLFMAYFLQFLDKVIINVLSQALIPHHNYKTNCYSTRTLWVYRKIFT
jgi:hypothetical protein